MYQLGNEYISTEVVIISGYFFSSFNSLELGSNSSRFGKMYSFTTDLSLLYRTVKERYENNYYIQ